MSRESRSVRQGTRTTWPGSCASTSAATDLSVHPRHQQLGNQESIHRDSPERSAGLYVKLESPRSNKRGCAANGAAILWPSHIHLESLSHGAMWTASYGSYEEHLYRKWFARAPRSVKSTSARAMRSLTQMPTEAHECPGMEGPVATSFAQSAIKSTPLWRAINFPL